MSRNLPPNPIPTCNPSVHEFGGKHVPSISHTYPCTSGSPPRLPKLQTYSRNPMVALSCIIPDALYLGRYVTIFTSFHFISSSKLNVPPPRRSSPLASLESAIEPNLRTEHNITHIVSILEDWPSEGPHHLTIDLDDSEMENLLVQLPSVCDFIDQALDSGGVVLVHCFAGISRSATCVIAYRKY